MKTLLSRLVMKEGEFQGVLFLLFGPSCKFLRSECQEGKKRLYTDDSVGD